MPNCGPVVALVGAHTLPKRNLVSPISRIAGRPEITRYTLMHSTKPTATMPHSRKIRWMACSMALRVRRLLPAVRFIEFSFPDNGEAPSPAAAGEGPPIRFYLAVGTAPAFWMREAASLEVAKSKNVCAAGDRAVPSLVTSTKGR